jgi:hypothetical protein
VFAYRKQVVPEMYSYIKHSDDWYTFLSACLLFDPPDAGLEEFAAYGDPTPITSLPLGSDPDKGSGIVAPPIKYLQDPYKAQEDARWYWEQIINDIGERFLKPLGLDVWAMAEAVKYRRPKPGEEFYGPADEYPNRVLQNEPRPYIFVGEETTEEDVRRAFRLLKRQRGYSKRGRPPRDRLTAIQCAILVDRYGWSYQQLTKRYGWTSKDAAKEHVGYGRELLS